MGKFNMNTKFGEAIEDERFVEIMEEYCPFIMQHPRLAEGLDFTLQEIIDMNLGSIAGISKQQMKKMAKRSMELE